MLCGGEEVLIVGMNLTKTVLLHTSEVKGVRGTKEIFTGSVPKFFEALSTRPGVASNQVHKPLGNESLVRGRFNLRLA
jgi:hypothetical protein